VFEAEPMSKDRAMEMDCMKRFYVHSGLDTPIFIRLREQLHCRFHVIHKPGLELSRTLFLSFFPRLCSRGLGSVVSTGRTAQAWSGLYW
jgi:hypothetical protein